MPEDYADTRQLPKEKTRIDREYLRRVVLQIVSVHIGQENRIERDDLVSHAAHRFGIVITEKKQQQYLDRIVRKAIEALRIEDAHGAQICSTQDDEGGYFMAANNDELNAHLAIEEARATTIFQSVQTRRRLVKMESPAQMRMPT